MATSNFPSMQCFDTVAWLPENEGDEYVGCMIDELRERLYQESCDNLKFHSMEIAFGYYEGFCIQILEPTDYFGRVSENEISAVWCDRKCEDNEYFDNYGNIVREYLDWKDPRNRERALKAYKKEVDYIEDLLAELQDEYGLSRFGVSARFSNGETWYTKVNRKPCKADPRNLTGMEWYIAETVKEFMDIWRCL